MVGRTFIEAGVDTTSNVIARALNRLAENPQLQQSLRHEIVTAHGGHDLLFDELMKLPLLNAVCCETLRLRVPLSTVYFSKLTDPTSDTLLPISSAAST